MSNFAQLNARLRGVRQGVLCGESEFDGIECKHYAVETPCPPYRKLHFSTTVQLVDAPEAAAALLGSEDVQCAYYVNFEENVLRVVAVSPPDKAVTLTIHEAFV